MVCPGLCPGSEEPAKSLEKALGRCYSDLPPSKAVSQMVAQRWDAEEALVPVEWVPEAPLAGLFLCPETRSQLSPHTQGSVPSRSCCRNHKNKL